MKDQQNYLAKGFTLAELMAVVIIVGILAGIGLGSYRRAIDRARFAEGLSNAHALATAVDAYYYDNQLKVPTSIQRLGVGISKTTSSSSTKIVTPTFEYVYGVVGSNTDSNTQRTITATPTDTGNSYAIKVYTEIYGGVNPDECNNNVDFCKSMGYTSCTGTTCTKP